MTCRAEDFFESFLSKKLIEKHAFVPSNEYFTGKPRFAVPSTSEKVHSSPTQANAARDFSFSLAAFPTRKIPFEAEFSSNDAQSPVKH